MAEYKQTEEYQAHGQKKKAKKFAKKPKDKNAPKRPTTAFFIFANEIRPEIREENPEASIGEIGKKLGQLWGDLSESQKESYKAINEKQRQNTKSLLQNTKRRESMLL